MGKSSNGIGDDIAIVILLTFLTPILPYVALVCFIVWLARNKPALFGLFLILLVIGLVGNLVESGTAPHHRHHEPISEFLGERGMAHLDMSSIRELEEKYDNEPEITFVGAAVELFTPHDKFQWSAAILLIVLLGGCVVYKIIKPPAPATGGPRPPRTASRKKPFAV